MKKTNLTFVAIIFLMGVQAQNFQCINNEIVPYFEDENSIKVIQIDSVVIEGDNLVYYNYPTLGEANEIYCYDPLGPSWIGRKMVAKPDGDNVFYNKDGQPITIKTLNEVGDYWICYEFFTGFYIKATVSELESMEFLGITDVVKKITFQAMYSNGTPVAHPVNDMYLLLSENHGLIRTINFNLFPELYDAVWEEECHEYVLCGLNNPSVGKQNLTKEQIFNMDVGDEYHTKRFIFDMSSTYDEQSMIYIILTKDISVTGDSIYYQAERCGRRGELVNNEIKYHYYNDTIQFSYFLNFHNYLDTISQKLIVDDNGNYREYAYNVQSKLNNSERLLKSYYFGLMSEAPHDCVQEVIFNKKEVGYEEYYYVEGLGGPYWDHDYFWNADYLHLVYYKKGDEEWGNPWSCDSLLTDIENTEILTQKVKVYPNPMKERTTFTFDNLEQLEIFLYIYDSFGKKIMEFSTRGNEIAIERGNLANGVYLYRLIGREKLLDSGKIIVQ